jgi:mono/diheme cytochrome c family protein
MLKPVLILAVAMGGGFTALIQQTQPLSNPPAEYGVPQQERQKANPVKPTAESIAAAKKTYGYDCAMCHGEKGDGKGETANDMKLSMKDWTNPATLKSMSDGELYYIIANGKGKMPAEGDRAKPDKIWNMVIYVRSFSDPSVLPAEKSGM